MMVKKKRLLAVEDAPDYQMIIKSTFKDDYEVTVASDGNQASLALTRQHFDLILLDIILPDSDGYEICSMLRSQEATKNTPIIFVTSRESVPDKVMGFSLGADDYITKPFNILELKARVAAKLRISDIQGQTSVMTRGDLEINVPTQRVYLLGEDTKEGRAKEMVDTTSTEFRLLLFMMQNTDHVLSRDQILSTVWGDSLNVTERTVDTHVSKLRKKLKNCGDYVKSVHGSGYRFSIGDSERKVA